MNQKKKIKRSLSLQNYQSLQTHQKVKSLLANLQAKNQNLRKLLFCHLQTLSNPQNPKAHQVNLKNFLLWRRKNLKALLLLVLQKKKVFLLNLAHQNMLSQLYLIRNQVILVQRVKKFLNLSQVLRAQVKARKRNRKKAKVHQAAHQVSQLLQSFTQKSQNNLKTPANLINYLQLRNPNHQNHHHQVLLKIINQNFQLNL